MKASEGTCLHAWYPPDREELLFCSVPITMYDRGTQALSATLTALFNAAFTVVFCVKLQKLLSMDKGQVPYRRRAFRALIVKLSILTVVGFVSTVVCWVCAVKFRATVGLLFVYADVLINCLINGLMFRYNERAYKRLCKHCVACVFAMCGGKKPQMESHRQLSSGSSLYLERTEDVDSKDSTNRVTSVSPQSPPTTPRPMEVEEEQTQERAEVSV
eukprot:CAMPEP_0197074662 /NCGR_PEP_ID=MMETSP1384-20130603/211222_1 /TAXON_ID=29189 /ORGANISM="Ammonia sp." /LENGTH=215 /DNA_ID=CAMNT_0042513503 /DNA_START=583 /DNA_END=1230 /DNA_ORIENTATION=+